MSLTITTIPILSDNYAYHLHAAHNNAEFHAIIDAGESKPILDYIAQHNIKLDAIISTHHHWDHTDGNAEIAAQTGAPIWAPDSSGRIKNIARPLRDGDQININGHAMHIITTPGHTSDHICLYFPEDHIIFTADTLFSMGCGRIFDSTAEEFYASMQKLITLPEETLIYPGHEYTLANAAFACAQAPGNPAIQTRTNQAKAQRAAGKPTIPTSLKQEKETNLFLTAKSAESFAKLRALKDSF